MKLLIGILIFIAVVIGWFLWNTKKVNLDKPQLEQQLQDCSYWENMPDYGKPERCK